VSLGGPVFDTQKLDWLNGRYLRESMSDEEFLERFAQWALRPEMLRQIVPLIKTRVERFSDVVPLAGFFLSGMPAITLESFAHKSLSSEEQLKILQFVAWRLDEVRDWHRDALEQTLVEMAGKLDVKIRDFLYPLFIAMAGTSVSTSVIDSIAILGLDLSRARLRHAMNVLGGVSGKQQKKLEKEFQSLSNSAGSEQSDN